MIVIPSNLHPRAEAGKDRAGVTSAEVVCEPVSA